MSVWQLQRTPYESEIDIVSDGRVIATVEAGEDKEEIASLIAAAPDMLRALEAVYGESEESDYLTQAQIQVMCRSAIQKARGEE